MRPADRLPAIPDAALTPEQRAKVAEFTALRGSPPFGPFVPMLRSPELMLRVGAVGDYCRHHSALGHALTELLILLVARRFTQDVEWAIHAPIALQAGLAPELIAAIADGRRPEALDADQALLLDAFDEIERNRRLSDVTYGRVVARFGERGAVDLAGTIGYYALLALMMNVARTDIGAGERLPRFPE